MKIAAELFSISKSSQATGKKLFLKHQLSEDFLFWLGSGGEYDRPLFYQFHCINNYVLRF